VHERLLRRRGGFPLIDPGVFRHRGAVGGLLVSVMFFAGNGYTLVLTMYLQAGLGYSPLRTAMSMVPFAVGLAIGSFFAPRLMVLGRRLVIYGALTMAAGMAMILAATRAGGTALDPWQLMPGLMVAGLGMSMVAGTLIVIVLAKVPPEYSGSASSLVNTSIQIGIAAGVALVGTVYFGQLDAGVLPVRAASVGLSAVVALYVLSAGAALVLPNGRVGQLEDLAPPPPPVSILTRLTPAPRSAEE